MKLTEMNKAELESFRNECVKEYEAFKAQGLKLDMSRGKPGVSQLALSMPMLDVINSESDMRTVLGNDTRNYGDLDGIGECRRLMADMTQYQEEIETLSEQDLSEEEFVNALNNLTVTAQKAVNDNKVGTAIIMGKSLFSVLLSIFIGLNANKWYYKHTVKNIRDIRSKEKTPEAVQEQILKTGGLAFGVTFLAILVEKAIIMGFELVLMTFFH